MTMMDDALLERRREINRKAARKSRSRQKEMADQIRKKYYEAQSANTKLVYERKRLVRERDELKTKLRDHRRSCPNCTSRSLEEYVELLDEALPRAIQIPAARRLTSLRTPSSKTEGASQPLSRSFSWPESSVANLPHLQWSENADDEMEMSSSSGDDDDDDDDAEDEEEEVKEEVEGPTNALEPLSSSDDFSFTELGIADPSHAPVYNYTGASSLLGDLQPPLGLFHFEEPSDFLGIEEDDPFSLLDNLSSSLSTQDFGRSGATDLIASSKSWEGVDLARISGLDSNRSSSSATVHDLGDASEIYYDDQQSEAIDLSKPRAASATTDPASVRASTTVDEKGTEQKASEPVSAKMQVFVGNIPLHVQTFIVGEK